MAEPIITPSNTETSLPSLDGRHRMSTIRDQKIARLSEKAGYAPEDRTNTYVNMGDFRESMNNKIINNYTPAELDYLAARMNQEYGVEVVGNDVFRRDAEGNQVPYEGQISTLGSLYEYGTADGGTKIGTWGGYDPKERYSDSYLAKQNETIGPRGVNREDLRRHYIMPIENVDLIEGLYHGNETYLQNRALRQRNDEPVQTYRDTRDQQFGSGATEIYNAFDRGTVAEDQTETLWNAFRERFRPETRGQLTPEERALAYEDRFRRERAENGVGAINRVVNAGLGIAPTLVSQLAVEPAVAVAEMLGADPESTEESRTRYFQDVLGYDATFANLATEKVQSSVKNIRDSVNKDQGVEFSDVWNIVQETATAPELLTTSLASVAALMIGVGKATKVGKAIADVEKSYKAGAITKEAAKVEVRNIRSNATILDNVAQLAGTQAGFITSVTGDANNRLNEFIANNDGEYEASDAIRMIGVSAAVMSIDRFSGAITLRNVPGVKNVLDKNFVDSVKGIVEELPADKYIEFVKAGSAGIAKLAGSATLEGGTEYIQTLTDLVSVQYATKKYGDDIGKIVADEQNQLEALTGAAIGSVMGGQMEGISMLSKATSSTFSGMQKPTSPTFSASTSEQKDRQVQDKELYSETMRNIAALQEVNNGAFTDKTIGDALRNYEVLKRTRYAAEALGSPEALKDVDESLRGMEAAMVAAIENSPNDYVLESFLPDATAITPTEKAVLAEEMVNMVINNKEGNIAPELVTKLNSFAVANNVPEGRVDSLIKSYSTVQNEIDEEARGVTQRENRLKILQESGTATPTDFQNEYEDIKNWYATTNESITQLQQGILKAEQRAATENNKEAGIKKSGNIVKNSRKPIKVDTDYTTHAQSRGLGKPFDITVSYNNGKWTAHVDSAKTTIAKKEDTRKRLYSLVNRYHSEVGSQLNADTMLTFGGMVIPAAAEADKAKGKQAARAKENTYVSNTVDTIRSLTGNSEAEINKVILGNVRSAKWHPSSQRARSNATITNSVNQGVEYSPTDVVYLHAPEQFTSSSKQKLSVLSKTSSVEAKELNAAMAAGATIVLDQDHTTSPSQLSVLRKLMSVKGYVPLGVKNDNFKNSEHVFVKESATAPNGQTYKEIHDQQQVQGKGNSDTAATRAKAMDKFLDAKIELEGAKALNEDTTELQKTYDAALKAVTPYFTKAAIDEAKRATSDASTADTRTYIDSKGEVVENGLAEDGEATVEDIDTVDSDISQSDNTKTSEQKAEAYVNRKFKESVTKFKQTKRASPDKPFASARKEALVAQEQRNDENRAQQAVNMLNAWKEAAMQRLSGSDLVEYVSKVLTNFGAKLHTRSIENPTSNDFVLNSQAKDVLENSVARDKELKYYVVSYITRYPEGKKVMKTRNVFTTDGVTVGEVVQGEKAYKLFGLTKSKMTSAEVTAIREMNVNATNLVKVGNPTVLGTIPVNALPQVFIEVTDSTRKAFQKVIAPLTDAEKNFEFRRDGTNQAGLFSLIDSPARALVFKEAGTVNDNMMAAIGVAIRDVVYRDKYKLTVGPKDTRTIAAMFNITEDAITDAHRMHATNYGMYAKSVANTLGQAVLGSLGISRKQDGSQSLALYERLVADLGNMALLVGEQERIFTVKDVNSDDLAKLYKDGEEWGVADDGTQATTRLVELSTKSKGVLSSIVETSLIEFDQIESFVPDVSRSAKEPFYGTRPDDKAIERMKTTVRNDLVGAIVPEEAQKAIERFAKTEYKLDMSTVKSFLDAFDKANSAERAGILKQLGYVDTNPENRAYKVLLADRKLIQDSINRDVLKDIESLRTAYNQIERTGKNSMYFGVFYTTNQRYSIDSTTLNPQASKLHRFFVQPAVQEVKLKPSANGVFEYNYTEKDGTAQTIDSSLYVRAALAQAFGVDIDKEYTENIISIGNTLLALPADKLADIRSTLYKDGEITLEVDGKKTSFEPDHLSHALSGLDFIEQYQKALKEGTDMTTSLTVEFDALTSGFSNKVQQFGRLDNVKQHLARVGVLDDTAYTQVLNNLTDSSRNNDTAGVNDALADPTSVDSYKNLAKKVIFKMNDKLSGTNAAGQPIVQEEGSRDRLFNKALRPMFEDLEALLPGSEQRNAQNIDNVVVSSALRNLFKPGFMIFNYSAGINRIVKNLGGEIAEKMLETISKTDFKKEAKDSPLRKAAEALVSGGNGTLYWSENKKETAIDSVEKLQEALQTIPVGRIMRKVSFVDARDSKKRLIDFISSDLIEPVYGSAMRDVFTDEFGEFIKIQDITNDAFKMSFAVFNDLFTALVNQHNAAGNTTVTETDVLAWIDMLKPAFPVIAGPLSSILEEGVFVYTVDRRTPNSLLVTAPSPQTRLNTEGGATSKSKVINPLLKSITAAANAGAVLPFHALDGAQMARLSESFSQYLEGIMDLNGGGAVLPIHDAITVPIPFADRAVWYYNRESQRLNNEYSMLSEIYQLTQRTADIVENGLKLKGQTNPNTGEPVVLKVNPSTIRVPNTLSTATKELTEDADEAVAFQTTSKSINDRMKEYYDAELATRANTARDNGKRYGVMVGLPGSLYEVKSNVKDNDFEFDDSYLSTYQDRGLYRTPSVTFETNAAETVEITDNTVDTVAEAVKSAAETSVESSGDVVEDTTTTVVNNATIAPESFKTNINTNVIDDLVDTVSNQIKRCTK